MELQVKHLYSGYRNVAVIKNIEFTIKPGEIHALIGLNGAGKSTLLKTILGLLSPLKGQVTINGQSIVDHHANYAKNIAYVPETPILYDELTLKEHIEMTALGYGMTKDDALKRAKPYLALFRLENHLNWFPAHFSKGMKQKVMIICALVAQADLLIIDEPFLGLDPLAIRDFSELLQSHAQQGGSVLLTTHVLGIASELSQHLLMLQQGELKAKGTLSDIQTQFQMPNATLDELYIYMAESTLQQNGVNAHDQ